MRTRGAWCVIVGALAAACGETAPTPAPPPRVGTVASPVEEGPLLPDPSVAEDPHLRALLAPNPPREEIEHFHEVALKDASDRRLFSALVFLLDSKSFEVELLAAELLSDGYRVALTEKIDVERGVRKALSSPVASIRLAVRRNLARALSPRADAHIRSSLGDERAGEGTFVEQIARRQLAHSGDPQHPALRGDGDLTRVDGRIGDDIRGPFPGRSWLEVRITDAASDRGTPFSVDIHVRTREEEHLLGMGGGSVARPFVCGGMSTQGLHLRMWGRRVGQDELRFWYAAIDVDPERR